MRHIAGGVSRRACPSVGRRGLLDCYLLRFNGFATGLVQRRRNRAPRSIGSAPRAAFTALRVAQVLIPFLVALGGQPELAFSFDVSTPANVDALLPLTLQHLVLAQRVRAHLLS